MSLDLGIYSRISSSSFAGLPLLRRRVFWLAYFFCLSQISLLDIAAGRLNIARGSTLTDSSFSYDGKRVTFSERPSRGVAVSAYWNPHNTPAVSEIQTPGFHVGFFGHGTGCVDNASNGQTKPIAKGEIERSERLVGILNAGQATISSWTPASDPKACPGAQANASGPAFVIAAEGKTDGAIGLYTRAGAIANPTAPAFWHPYAAGGQTGLGANAFIEGTFITWRFDWKNGHAIKPWSNTGSEFLPDKLILLSRQSATVTVSRLPQSPGIQAKQQFAITFANPDCLHIKSAIKLCQIRYMVQTVVDREGFPNGPRQRPQIAHLLLDPAQGGLAVIYGGLGMEGESTYAADGSLPIWHSRGTQTQTGTFWTKTFVAEIKFDEFLAAIRFAAAKLLHERVQDVSEGNMLSLVGVTWSDPNRWEITDANNGQEVRNSGVENSAEIAGRIDQFSISSERE